MTLLAPIVQKILPESYEHNVWIYFVGIIVVTVVKFWKNKEIKS